MKKAIPIILAILFLFTACNMPAEPTPEGPYGFEGGEVDSMAYTDTPESEVIKSTEEPKTFQVETLDPARVAYDFTADYCSAVWSTNATFLPCPGLLDEIENGGYIEVTDHTVLEGMVSVEAPMLIGLPGFGYPIGGGLFGKYPPFTVYPGDLFHATIACQGDAECDLDFWLEYYPPGASRATGWEWHHQAGDGPQKVTVDLSGLAGQTIEFFLVLRPQEEQENQWAAWIQPYIERDPNAQPAPTVDIQPTPEPDPGDTTPGVISGKVDMASAPPYLKSSYGDEGGSSPVAVVFFNLSNGTYWWIHTSLTGHPYFQMTITPGEYQVVAYAPGVGDVPYVAGGYTGSNPSCGKQLKTITMPPNGRVEDIVVSDWNWTCGGEAYRQPKPGGVPLP